MLSRGGSEGLATDKRYETVNVGYRPKRFFLGPKVTRQEEQLLTQTCTISCSGLPLKHTILGLRSQILWIEERRKPTSSLEVHRNMRHSNGNVITGQTRKPSSKLGLETHAHNRHTHTHVRTHTQTHSHTHTQIYIHPRTDTQTLIHVYTHTHI